MNNDITIVYYTANLINDKKAERIRQDLVSKSGGLPIISVSQSPIDLGENICIGNIGISLWNLFHQVLVGARKVKTKFMVCAEDDYIYGVDRFSFDFPRDDTFYYDLNRWGLNRDGRLFWRNRVIFGMCMAPTELMIETLENRFAKYGPDSKMIKYFSEPGKYEEAMGIPLVRLERIRLGTPTITFNHKDSMGRARMIRPTDIVVRELPGIGQGIDIWNKYMEE